MWNDEGDEDGLWWVTIPRIRASSTPQQTFDNRAASIRALTFEAPDYTPPPLVAPPPGVFALDLETEDPDLSTRGPSWAFEGRGAILGISVAWRDFEAYYPFGHNGGNIDPAPVMRWLG